MWPGNWRQRAVLCWGPPRVQKTSEAMSAYEKLQDTRRSLPIFKHRDELLALIEQNQVGTTSHCFGFDSPVLPFSRHTGDHITIAHAQTDVSSAHRSARCMLRMKHFT